MIDWLNDTFGISSDVSVPTLISIIVFVIGGIVRYSFYLVKEYTKRARTRKTFYYLLKETVRNLRTKEKYSAEFFSKLKPEYEGEWYFPFSTLSYLETFFDLGFLELYQAFQKKNLWKFRTNQIRDKSFNRVWAVLRNLRFFEQRIVQELEEFNRKYEVAGQRYNESLEAYRVFHDNLARDSEGMQLPSTESRLYNYLTTQDSIWFAWQQIEPERRTHPSITYNNLVKPISDLNKRNIDLPLALQTEQVIIACINQYIEIEGIFAHFYSVFKQYYFTYRSSRFILKKCLDILE